jgi:hypothetical protein
MRRISRSLIASVAVLVLGSSTAIAAPPGGNPHFIKNQTFGVLDGNDLVVHFKESGLPSGATETITVTGTYNLTLQCINNGGNNPKDPKKTKITEDAGASGDFTADQSGNVVGSLTLIAPEVEFSCPPGQTVVASDESWTNVTITDDDTDVSLSLGTFTIG